MRMLVVDDEVDIANMLAEYFRMEGYEVVCANSGAEALAAAGVAEDPIETVWGVGYKWVAK